MSPDCSGINAPISYPPNILGYSWLRRHSPYIGRATGVIHVWGTSCHRVSLSSHHPHHPYMSQSLWVQATPGCPSNTTTSGLSSARPRPLHYHNIDYGCANDLLPGTRPTRGHLYSLSTSREWQQKLIFRKLWLQASFVPLPLLFFLLRWTNPWGLVLITGTCINILIFTENQKEDISHIQTSVFCSRTHFLSRLKNKFHTSSVSFLGFHCVSRQDSNGSSKGFLCRLLASPWLPKAVPTLLLLPFHAQLQLFGSPPHSPDTHWGPLPVVPCSG